ncbi:unnamed protein product [Vicia faba]|uniref:SAUR-like auxin-responsive protein family n=1 Tax=Vicia faba TaxID=3906 RepID=A0AAV1AZK0_VICFA|nr:unnamed protein product [Vicia faba]
MEVTKKLRLKNLISKVLKGVLFLERSKVYVRVRSIGDDDEETATIVPEGYFVVIAMHGDERKRFVLELEYLRDSRFMKLLEEAKEEYGYQQEGAIAVPCRPQELEKIIENRCNTSL